MKSLSLDDLYAMVAHIYSEQNYIRSSAATFAHFVEVCGMLTIHDRKKRREGIEVLDALCKALGWYFPLLAKFHVRSVEDIVFRKYPYACPYCRQLPHQDGDCKVVRGTESTLNHQAVRELYIANRDRKPHGLNSWQQMFAAIYPRRVEDSGRSTLGLFEEVGELAEAIRVFDRHPKYFAGEAADVFSYLMGVANEHAIRLAQDSNGKFSFEQEFLSRFPGLCTKCGFQVCVCPAVPIATVGRMAKELEIGKSEDLFNADAHDFAAAGKNAAAAALELAGGYAGITGQFPFDRGDTNKALVLLCLNVATAVEGDSPATATQLRSLAIQVSRSTAEAGSPTQGDGLRSLLASIRAVWKELDPQMRQEIESDAKGLAAGIGGILDTTRVLVVGANPITSGPLRVASEIRAIEEACQASQGKIQVENLIAASPDDLRRRLLKTQYDILHFCGHGDGDSLLFEDANSQEVTAPLSGLRDLVQRHRSIKCLVLSACKSGAKLKKPIAPFTVVMRANVDDDAAVDFARGFYDALAAGRDFAYAIAEGKNAADLKGGGVPPVKVLADS